MALGADRKFGALQTFYTKVVVRDDKKLYFGDDEDISIEYDEDGTNEGRITGGVRIPSGNTWAFDGGVVASNATRFTTPKVGAANIDTGVKVQELTLSAATMIDATTTGMYSTITVIPAGAFVYGYACSVITKFTGGGNATITLAVGDGTTGDYYGTSGVSLSAAALLGSVATKAQTAITTAAKKIKAIATVDSDFTSVKTKNDGKAKIKVFYSEFF